MKLHMALGVSALMFAAVAPAFAENVEHQPGKIINSGHQPIFTIDLHEAFDASGFPIPIQLPELVVPGDVVFLDASGLWSDVLRFQTDPTSSQVSTPVSTVYFFSDASDADSTGESGFPSFVTNNLSSNSLRRDEAFAPATFTVYNVGNVYSVFSVQGANNSTPEPGSIALLIGAGISGASLMKRRRR